MGDESPFINPDVDQSARSLYEMFVGFKLAGFTAAEALTLVGEILRAKVQEND